MMIFSKLLFLPHSFLLELAVHISILEASVLTPEQRRAKGNHTDCSEMKLLNFRLELT